MHLPPLTRVEVGDGEKCSKYCGILNSKYCARKDCNLSIKSDTIRAQGKYEVKTTKLTGCVISTVIFTRLREGAGCSEKERESG